MDGTQQFLCLVAGVLAFGFVSSWWSMRQQAWKMHDPVEQQLRRVSEGAAVIVFTVGVPVYAFGFRPVLNFLPLMAADPARNWPYMAAVGALLLIGGARFLGGARNLAGFRDPMRANMAVVRLAFGVTLAVYVRRKFPAPDLLDWFGLAETIAPVVGVWFAVTGLVRFLLMTLGGPRKAKPPVLHPSPRGRAGDASEAETASAMSGSGGEKLNLDEREF